jgi:folate-dependent phosphoribosylglycinamide formyltransferase PurN
MYRLGWFSTGRDPAARELLTAVHRAIEQGKIRAEIEFVFSNREPGQKEESDLLYQLVQSYHIPLICLSWRRFKVIRGNKTIPTRVEYHREAMKSLQGFHPDLCVLAGYMLIVSDEMCQRYPMINLHPAAPGGPTGTWQEVIWKLIESQAERTGAMMHVVTPELDRGPPATYCTFPIRGEPFDKHWQQIRGRSIQEIKGEQGERNPLFRIIRQHGAMRELPLIVSTLKAFADKRVTIESGRVVDARGKPIEGYDLTEEVSEALRGGGGEAPEV